ncbi:MAG: glycoside hydrolase family 16 protein [Saprospiraceae bacterium]|nr:glycoside hydrolase family 16 protein [Saprospiraceae bacterium]
MRTCFYIYLGIAAGFGLLLVFVQCSKQIAPEKAVKNLVWSDEFNYTGLPDSTKWSYDEGNGCNQPSGCGWGNNELQYYTAHRKENARVENGHLIVEARREKWKDRSYTSARLVTKNKGDWQYGRIEVRAKLPITLGSWSAIWMLPTQNVHGGWPADGEIDIMEYVGYIPDTIYGTVHTEAFNGMKGTQKTGSMFFGKNAQDFHLYALDWYPDRIDFWVDNTMYHRFKNEHKTNAEWPFDKAFHLILNMAVGGNWGGKKGVDEQHWPQQMLVDYVRVYK